MIYTDPVAAAPAFADMLAQARRILLLTHVNPDGDAIGSLLGTYHVLRAIGKEPIPVAASAPPSYSAALAGIADVTVYEAGGALPDAELTWMLDTASLERVGQIFRDHGPAITSRPLMIVDHHVTNEGAGTLNLIRPDAASCAELLFQLFQAMALPISPEAATCLLLGTTTDTQSFQTSATTPQTLRTAADMLVAGADQRAVVDAVYFSVPAETAVLSGLALGELRREGGLLWARVSQAMLAASGAANEATDEAIMRMQRVGGMRVAAMFKERADGTVKISLRSVPGINVAEIARTWGGGGHAQAAGADLPMGLDEAEAAVLPLLRKAIGV